MANELAPTRQNTRVAVMDAEPIFDTAMFDHMVRIAQTMGTSTLLPEHLRVMVDERGAIVPMDKRATTPCWLDEKASTANAFLIVNAARNFGGMDPFALAQSSYFVHGRLGYEGKLVHAMIQRRVGDLEYVYNDANPDSEDYGVTVTAFVPNSNPPRKASVTGTVREWGSRKNGALNQQWKGRAGATRMLNYRGAREWARLFAPGLVLGLLDDDDLEQMREDLRARSARQLPAPAGRPFNPLAADEAEVVDGLGRGDLGAGVAAVREALATSPGPAASIPEAQGPGGAAFEAGRAAGLSEAETFEAIGSALVRETPHDAETGEVQGEGSAAAGGASQGQEAPITTEQRDVGSATMGAKPSTKRLKSGWGQRIDRVCMFLVQAADTAALDAAWEEHARPFILELEEGGYPETAAQRMREAFAARLANFETMAKAKVPGTSAPVATPAAVEAPTASQVEAVAPAEEGEDWSVWLDHLRSELAAAQTFEDVDDVTDTTVNGRDLPKDVGSQADDMVQARRKAIGDANARTQPGDVEVSDFPGESSITKPAPAAPSQDQLSEMVNTWISDMRRLKSVSELDAYNLANISPFMQGPHAGLLDQAELDDAKQTFASRRKLMAKREEDAAHG